KLCTTVEPEKSRIPARARKPPPQIQWPAIGYITAVNTSENTRNELYFIRSFTEPDTMVADVPQNTSSNRNFAMSGMPAHPSERKSPWYCSPVAGLLSEPTSNQPPAVPTTLPSENINA